MWLYPCNLPPMHFGLVATFAVDKSISLQTVKVSRELYDQMLRRSLFYLLGWAQRTVLLSHRGYALKERLSRGVSLDYEFNRYLISYYETMNGILQGSSVPIYNERGKYSTSDIEDAPLIVTELAEDKYLLFVPVKHVAAGHVDMIPLLSLNDV
jgi:hypothetical protein